MGVMPSLEKGVKAGRVEKPKLPVTLPEGFRPLRDIVILENGLTPLDSNKRMVDTAIFLATPAAKDITGEIVMTTSAGYDILLESNKE